MRVIILGKGYMLANLIRGAILANVDIVGVFRYENLYMSGLRLLFHDITNGSPELTLIKKHKLYDMKFESANSPEFKKEVLNLNADLILVGTWSEKLDDEIIKLPKIGTINVHPSLLPKYRGPNPYLQAIWHQEKVSGVTFHLMSGKFDAGAVLAQGKVDILNIDTGKELREKTIFRARLLCAELLNKLKTGYVVPVPQNEAEATYFKEISPQDMTLDFTKETSAEIMAHVRAFYPFRPVYIEDGKTFWIVNPYKMLKDTQTAKPGTVISREEKAFTIACKDGVAVKFFGLKKYWKIFDN